jgi:predicted dehydrogenase
LVRLDGGQASLIFDGGAPHAPRDTTYIGGTDGSLMSDGPDLGSQNLTLTTSEGIARPKLEGKWFNDGFRGAMGELLCAIEQDRTPENSAQENLRSLALAFAAVRSRHTSREVAVGEVRRMDG